MKTYLLPVALAALAVSAIAAAQTPPSSSSPPSGSTSEPPSSMQAPAATGSSSYSSTDAKSMKECLAKQKAANAQITDADAKRACAKTETK